MLCFLCESTCARLVGLQRKDGACHRRRLTSVAEPCCCQLDGRRVVARRGRCLHLIDLFAREVRSEEQPSEAGARVQRAARAERPVLLPSASALSLSCCGAAPSGGAGAISSSVCSTRVFSSRSTSPEGPRAFFVAGAEGESPCGGSGTLAHASMSASPSAFGVTLPACAGPPSFPRSSPSPRAPPCAPRRSG